MLRPSATEFLFSVETLGLFFYLFYCRRLSPRTLDCITQSGLVFNSYVTYLQLNKLFLKMKRLFITKCMYEQQSHRTEKYM